MKSSVKNTIQAFGKSSSIHGIGYISNQSMNRLDRCIWFVLFVASTALATLLVLRSYNEWQNNQVVTTLKTVAKPVTDLEFPAVTICGAGQHMSNVERALYNNFNEWDQARPEITREKELAERFENYMREVFQITEKGLSIMDVLDTMITPSQEGSGTQAVVNNELACAEEKRRKKRTTIGKCTHKVKELICVIVLYHIINYSKVNV